MQMVRMLQPTPEGIPVEVYCFTRETDWVAYEAVQGAVFDHLFAVLPRLRPAGLPTLLGPRASILRILI